MEGKQRQREEGKIALPVRIDEQQRALGPDVASFQVGRRQVERKGTILQSPLAAKQVDSSDLTGLTDAHGPDQVPGGEPVGSRQLLLQACAVGGEQLGEEGFLAS